MKVRTGHAINQSSRYIRIFTETRVDVSLSLCQWRLYRGRDWEASAFGWVHAPISYQPILTRSASKSISSKARLPYFFYTRNNMDGRMDDWSHFLSSFIFWDLLHVLHFPFVVVAVFYIHLDEFAAAWEIFSRCLDEAIPKSSITNNELLHRINGHRQLHRTWKLDRYRIRNKWIRCE